MNFIYIAIPNKCIKNNVYVGNKSIVLREGTVSLKNKNNEDLKLIKGRHVDIIETNEKNCICKIELYETFYRKDTSIYHTRGYRYEFK